MSTPILTFLSCASAGAATSIAPSAAATIILFFIVPSEVFFRTGKMHNRGREGKRSGPPAKAGGARIFDRLNSRY
ncbi:MAG: hypothetical protein V9G24_01025 [Rhodoblastus sp.]